MSSGPKTIEITLSDDGCEPRSIAASSGPTTFKVTNSGTSAVTEFEVLDGSKILGESENVIPGSDRNFSLTLEAGSYTTKCPGGAKFEQGTLQLEPAQIANGSVELLNEVSVSKITGEEDRYSYTDLSDFNYNLAGSKAALRC